MAGDKDGKGPGCSLRAVRGKVVRGPGGAELESSVTAQGHLGYGV